MKNVTHNKGFSLVELLIASSIGLIVIGVVGSVFLSGYKSSNQRSLELLLSQDVNDALSFIKQDILRSGYNKGATSSYIMSGATDVVTLLSSHSKTDNCITYAYHDGMEQNYRSIYYSDGKDAYNKSVGVLNLSTSKNSSIGISSSCTSGESLLDQNHIAVSDFKATEKILSVNGIINKLIKIEISAYLRSKPSVNVSKVIEVKTRNWKK